MNDDLLRFDLFLLDFDGTLVDYFTNEKKALYSLLSHFHVPKQEWKQALQTYHEINVRYWTAFRRGEYQPDQVRTLRFKELANFYPQIDDPDYASALYLKYFVEHVTVIDGGFELLDILKKRNKKMFVVTNGFHKVQTERLKRTGMLNIVNGFVTSEQVDAPKPDPTMLLYAMEKLSVKDKNNVVIIGDSIDSDISAAKNLGISSIFLGKHPRDEKIVPDYIFPSTKDLVSYLKRK